MASPGAAGLNKIIKCSRQTRTRGCENISNSSMHRARTDDFRNHVDSMILMKICRVFYGNESHEQPAEWVVKGGECVHMRPKPTTSPVCICHRPSGSF